MVCEAGVARGIEIKVKSVNALFSTMGCLWSRREAQVPAPSTPEDVCDPGLFFLLASERHIHDCLEMDAVRHVQPPLVAG